VRLGLLGRFRNTNDESDRIKKIKAIADRCKDTTGLDTEESVKMTLILPLISALGYDIHNKDEVIAEYVADVGIKRGEKVDYAISIDGNVSIIIEAKRTIKGNVDNYVSQLYRYFSVTPAKVGILTDGVTYLFYTDSKTANIMDLEPYLYINMKKLTDTDIDKLLKYSKDGFSDKVINEHIAYERVYSAVSNILNSILDGDSDEFMLSYIKNKVGVEVNSSTINTIIQQELNDIIKSNNNLEKVVKYKKQRENKGSIKHTTESKGESQVKIGDEPVQGRKIKYAIVFGERYDKISFANLLVEVFNKIYDIDNRLIDKIIENESFHTGSYSKITRDISKVRKPRELRCGGVFVETHLSSTDIIKVIIKALGVCDISLENIQIYLYKTMKEV
jgi:hypothetical protein